MNLKIKKNAFLTVMNKSGKNYSSIKIDLLSENGRFECPENSAVGQRPKTGLSSLKWLSYLYVTGNLNFSFTEVNI